MHMKHLRTCCTVILLLFISFAVYAKPPSTTTTGVRLGEIQIEGLKRTKLSVVRALIPLEKGQIIFQEDVENVETVLLKSGIFSSVSLSLTPQTQDSTPIPVSDLVVTVEEKWSLIPVPYFTSDGESFNGGLFLIEANLFGYNTFLMTAVYGGTNGLRGLLVYSNPSIARSAWSHTLTGGFGTSDSAVYLPNGTLVRAFTSRYLNIGAGIGYSFTPQLDMSANATFRDWKIQNTETGIDSVPLTDSTYIEPEISLRYDDTRLADVLTVGTTASLSSRFLFLESGWEVSGDLSWSLAIWETQRLKFMLSGGYGEMPALAETDIDGKDGYRTLPKSSSADRWASITTGYDLPIFRTSWGVGIIGHFWEVGMYDTDVIAEPQIFGGPGAGFRLYLRKVAIPAVGVDIAYNMFDPSWIFSVSVGVQM